MAQPSGLRIRGARQNNLKNISLEIPHDRLTVVTGVSGSGKSSLAFDTLFAEGQWRYIESLSTYARMFLDRVDRPDVDKIEQIRPAVALEQKNRVRTAIAVVLDRVVLDPAQRGRISESIEAALREGGGQLAVEIVGGPTRVFAEDFRCGGCGAALERPQPLLFSFNHPLGACPECKGFGNVLKYDEARVVPDRSKSLADGAVEPWTHPSGKWYQRQLLKAARRHQLDTDAPWETLPAKARALVYEGDGSFPGIQGVFEEVESYRYKLHVRAFLSRYRSQSPCPTCRGARLKPAALAVRVGGLTIAEFTALTVDAAARLPGALAPT